MKQSAFLLLSATLAFTGCGDSEPATSAPAPATQASSDNPLSGVWVKDDQVLVLENGGDFYLPDDGLRQGLNWEQQGETFTFRFLDSDALRVEERRLKGKQQGDTLTLTAPAGTQSAPETEEDAEESTDAALRLEGEYQRDRGRVGHLSGQVQLPGDADLPDQAVLTVSLLTDDDLVLRRIIRLEGEADRYPFRLYFPAQAVEADASYQVRSQILANGGIYYQSANTDLTHTRDGFATLTLPLDPVMSNSETLRGTLAWQLGNPVFILCNTDQRLQISGPQGEALIDEALESQAYPHQPRVVTLSGVRRKIPGEQTGSTQAAVAVESFSLEDGDSSCRLPTAALTQTRWSLTHLGQENVPAQDNARAPHMVLADGQVRGNGGCNSFQGGYQTNDPALTFQALTSTEMACPALETEQAFFQALASSDHYRIDGELLTLFDKDDQAVASFQALFL